MYYSFIGLYKVINIDWGLYRFKGEWVFTVTLKLPGIHIRQNPLLQLLFLCMFLQHDHMVAGFLSALQAYDKKRPVYASTVSVELLSDSSTPK